MRLWSLIFVGLNIVISSLCQDFQPGRATRYEYNNAGSCGFKDIFPSESLGDPLHILAVADCSPLYANSCGLCYEIKCRNGVITDDNGVELDRTKACYDEESSVVLRVADSCPSYYPANQESNSRWCRCQTSWEHFDISSEAFSQLADVEIGVIGTNWRQVDCDAQPDKPARVRDNKRYADALPASSENQHRTQSDWTDLVASWVAVQEDQAVNPFQVNVPRIYSSASGNLLPSWTMLNATSGNADPSPPSKQCDKPVDTGRGQQGEPACFFGGYGHGVGFTSNITTATNTTIISFWVFTNTSRKASRMIQVTIGGKNTTCDYINLDVVEDINTHLGWSSYSLFVPSFNKDNSGKVFEGCEDKPASVFDTVYFLNGALDAEWVCLDDITWF